MLLLLLLLVGLPALVDAFPPYQESIPNGQNVEFDGRAWNAVGHNNPNSGSRLNRFGDDFVAAGRQWTEELCRIDSDGDGKTNGEELGDPECIWTLGATPTRTSEITHPGFFEGVDTPRESGIDQNGKGAIGVLVVAFFLSIISAVFVRWRLPVKISRTLFWPGRNGWTLANFIGVMVVFVTLFCFSLGIGAGGGAYGMMIAFGLSASFVSSLTILWAFMRAGLHHVFAMRLEAAWRIHFALGIITLLFGTLHGLLALTVVGRRAFIRYGFGFFGLLLMVLGVLPAVAHALFPGRMTYDRWKMLHFLSLVGYFLVLFHLMDHLRNGSTALILAFLINVGVTLAYLVQRISTVIHTKQVTVVDSVVAEQHLFLRLHVPGFQYVPGQWAQLSVPSISSVAHPFTIVPDTLAEKEHLQFIVKVSGAFTKQLAETDLAAQTMRLKGPYGAPSLPPNNVDGVVFVLGGTGVTPALSLVRAASKLVAKGNVRVFWQMRSLQLLERSAPLLKPYLQATLERHCIRLTGEGCGRSSGRSSSRIGGSASAKSSLPLGARMGREALDPWLETTADHFARENLSSILLFVCGPPSLVKDAKRVAKKSEGATAAWRLHVEQFEFLPWPQGGDKAILQGRNAPSSAIGKSDMQQQEAEDVESRGGFAAWKTRLQLVAEP